MSRPDYLIHALLPETEGRRRHRLLPEKFFNKKRSDWEHFRCLHTSFNMLLFTVRDELQQSYATSVSHLAKCRHSWVHLQPADICALLWANGRWLGLPHHGHIFHASHLMLHSHNHNEKNLRAHAQPNFMGLNPFEGLLLNFNDKCSMTNSSSSLSLLFPLKRLSSEVEPHYHSTTWESPPPSRGEVWQLLNPPSSSPSAVVSDE